MNAKYFKPIDVQEGDGNCFYRSLCQHLYFSKKHTHTSLPNDFSRYVRVTYKKKSSILHSFLNNKYWRSDINYEDNAIDSYLLNIDKNRVLAGTLEAACMAILYDIEIVFIESRTQLIVDQHKASTTVAMYINFFELPSPQATTIHILWHHYGNPFTPTHIHGRREPNHYLYLKEEEYQPGHINPNISCISLPFQESIKHNKEESKKRKIQVVSSTPSKPLMFTSKKSNESSFTKQKIASSPQPRFNRPYPTSKTINNSHKRVSFNVAQKAW